MIRLDSVNLEYQTDAGRHEAIKGVDLSLERGTPCAVIGPTGCGKTSLLYLMAGLVSPSSGQVRIDGVPLRGIRRGTSLILQQHGLFPWKDAYGNASLGLVLGGTGRREVRERIEGLMEKLGIWDVRRSYPGQLSGGQRQRVAIARSLATEPDILLMDEPFSALDAMTRESLQNLLAGLWREGGFTFVLVTHSIEEAVYLGRRIVVLSRRPGRIVRILDNPPMGSSEFRLSESFHSMCSEVRRTLEEIP